MLIVDLYLFTFDFFILTQNRLTRITACKALLQIIKSVNSKCAKRRIFILFAVLKESKAKKRKQFRNV